MSADTSAANEDAEREVINVATQDEPVDQADQVEQQAEVQDAPKEEHVPLSALQKERRKRQDIERELQWLKDQQMRQSQAVQHVEQEPEEDAPASKRELANVKRQAVREVLETTWISQNPEKAADINEKLTEFLRQKPHLARAIEDAPNRYEEAWTLMDALTPKQKISLSKPIPAPKKDAPGNPAALPKSHGMAQSVDLMSMTDAEFNAWRRDQKAKAKR